MLFKYENEIAEIGFSEIAVKEIYFVFSRVKINSVPTPSVPVSYTHLDVYKRQPV